MQLTLFECELYLLGILIVAAPICQLANVQWLCSKSGCSSFLEGTRCFVAPPQHVGQGDNAILLLDTGGRVPSPTSSTG